MSRLREGAPLPPGVRAPGYNRAAHGEGIVHLGLGAFHKAHQAAYTDDALAASGGDWRIAGVSLRSAEPARALTAQDGLYTLLEADAEGTRARVVGAVSRALAHAHGDAAMVRTALAAPATRVVALTVTEKGYGIDRGGGGCDPTHPAIAHDLAHPEAAVGVAGLLTRALADRRAAGAPPFAALSCDNLPGNGELLRGLVLDFASRTAPDLRGWIADEVGFPSSMVDRITPAPNEAVRRTAREATGHEDAAAVRSEAFSQWVIEDRFPQGRPDWEAGGALFVPDVAPYERMKLRMLNGTHSMLAYVGFLLGHRTVRDVMKDPVLAPLVRRHLAAAAATLDPVPGIDLRAYARDLAARFANPGLAHETYQIAMDGTEKMPQRIFAPALDAVRSGLDVDAFAFATAAWMRYATGRRDDGSVYPVRDPREGEIAARLEGAATAEAVAAALAALPGLMPDELRRSAAFMGAVGERLAVMLDRGMASAATTEVA